MKTSKTAIYNSIKTFNVEKIGFVHQYNFTDRRGRDWEVESDPITKELSFYRKGNYDSRVIVENMSNKKDISKRISDFINSL